MTCDVIGIAQCFFEIQESGLVLCTVSKFQAFASRFALENVSNRAKTVLATLLALNVRYLSKILMS